MSREKLSIMFIKWCLACSARHVGVVCRGIELEYYVQTGTLQLCSME